MAWADLLPHFPHFQIQSIQQECQHVTITLVSTRKSDRCPTCQTQTMAGLLAASTAFPVRVRLWFCWSKRGAFAAPMPLVLARRAREDLSALADRYQRRTQAVTQLLCSVAAEAFGQAGARLAAQMQLPTSRSTLLRCLIRHAPCSESVPRVVGVDDFAWTKRRSSGTILVDLETHRLLALLADCEGDTVAAWFRRHPSVQIVTRDRSPTFADAIRCGAPMRFTLLIASIYI